MSNKFWWILIIWQLWRQTTKLPIQILIPHQIFLLYDITHSPFVGNWPKHLWSSKLILHRVFSSKYLLSLLTTRNMCMSIEHVYMWVCVCVCSWVRERERERKKKRERERFTLPAVSIVRKSQPIPWQSLQWTCWWRPVAWAPTGEGCPQHWNKQTDKQIMLPPAWQISFSVRGIPVIYFGGWGIPLIPTWTAHLAEEHQRKVPCIWRWWPAVPGPHSL